MSKPYIVEVAEITVTDTDDFEAAVAEAKPYFLAAEGCTGLALHRVVETPEVYRLIVKWRTVEDHMVTFRQSEGFQRWRELASPFFAKAPVVTHSAEVDLG
ncbi:antibiotic biosynthesis monooxygenase family protein [Agrobacterium tumefaciens]|uniref:Antibiotic biosynthesis monooxygenase n=1 Tax=Agrobacterium tumefaciens TaxID=358 RepID=A0AA44F6V8_AGRTU|nr:antibiotic biosynthesis monooxygenase family protein [Agrobacterium tumefaciens]NTB87564.1 antibiotic biosynthesis monooxygenase [Agrobacterium tumefaciens]NTC19741.1 antibiotic biosynthesis monooxygenase [Agrobacterium tumefaciens]NTC29669.1 antibiotic biosynthesis monooxygenase [Agrobacterium tumefaciens]